MVYTPAACRFSSHAAVRIVVRGGVAVLQRFVGGVSSNVAQELIRVDVTVSEALASFDAHQGALGRSLTTIDGVRSPQG